jgi:hypothetical protein
MIRSRSNDHEWNKTSFFSRQYEVFVIPGDPLTEPAWTESTERRFFVIDGLPHGANNDVPQIAHECAKRVQSRFYSADVVQQEDDELRIVEVGDGQVSDLVGWTPERFASILAQHLGPGSRFTQPLGS